MLFTLNEVTLCNRLVTMPSEGGGAVRVLVTAVLSACASLCPRRSMALPVQTQGSPTFVGTQPSASPGVRRRASSAGASFVCSFCLSGRRQVLRLSLRKEDKKQVTTEHLRASEASLILYFPRLPGSYRKVTASDLFNSKSVDVREMIVLKKLPCVHLRQS